MQTSTQSQLPGEPNLGEFPSCLSYFKNLHSAYGTEQLKLLLILHYYKQNLDNPTGKLLQTSLIVFHGVIKMEFLGQSTHYWKGLLIHVPNAFQKLWTLTRCIWGCLLPWHLCQHWAITSFLIIAILTLPSLSLRIFASHTNCKRSLILSM